MDLKLFFSTFALIFVAELPDKTAFATLLLATRKRPTAIFVGVAAAFVIQSIVAVSFGTALSHLPHAIVQVGAGILFLLFSLLMWIRKDPTENDLPSATSTHGDSHFWPTVYSSFIVIFIAEWGDLTQLATATLAAKHQSPFTVFSASVLALWAVTGLAIFAGNRAKALIQPVLLKKVAAIAFAGVGAVLLFRALRT